MGSYSLVNLQSYETSTSIKLCSHAEYELTQLRKHRHFTSFMANNLISSATSIRRSQRTRRLRRKITRNVSNSYNQRDRTSLQHRTNERIRIRASERVLVRHENSQKFESKW